MWQLGVQSFFKDVGCWGLKYKNGYRDTQNAKKKEKRTPLLQNKMIFIGVLEVKIAVLSFKTYSYFNSVQYKCETEIYRFKCF